MDHSNYSTREEWLNSATHAVGFLLSIFGVFALLSNSLTFIEIVVSLVYGASLAFMFLSSAVYHASTSVLRKVFLRKLDHVAIYLLIAGTYTPFMLFAVGGKLGVIALTVVWLIGILGIVFKLTIGDKYPKVGVATYAIMGWFALFLIYPIYQALSAGGFTLLLIGGLWYSAGIPLYMMKSRHYSHALWHVCVAIGAACHFFAIYLHVMN